MRVNKSSDPHRALYLATHSARLALCFTLSTSGVQYQVSLLDSLHLRAENRQIMKVRGHYETDSRYPPPNPLSSVWQAPLIRTGARMVAILPGLQIPQEDHIFLGCQTSRRRSCCTSPRDASSRYPLPLQTIRKRCPDLSCRLSKHMGVLSDGHRP